MTRPSQLKPHIIGIILSVHYLSSPHKRSSLCKKTLSPWNENMALVETGSHRDPAPSPLGDEHYRVLLQHAPSISIEYLALYILLLGL